MIVGMIEECSCRMVRWNFELVECAIAWFHLTKDIICLAQRGDGKLENDSVQRRITKYTYPMEMDVRHVRFCALRERISAFTLCFDLPPYSFITLGKSSSGPKSLKSDIWITSPGFTRSVGPGMLPNARVPNETGAAAVDSVKSSGRIAMRVAQLKAVALHRWEDVCEAKRANNYIQSGSSSR